MLDRLLAQHVLLQQLNFSKELFFRLEKQDQILKLFQLLFPIIILLFVIHLFVDFKLEPFKILCLYLFLL